MSCGARERCTLGMNKCKQQLLLHVTCVDDAPMRSQPSKHAPSTPQGGAVPAAAAARRITPHPAPPTRPFPRHVSE